MNGKCRRVKGCWSRGIPRGGVFFSGGSTSTSTDYFSLKFDNSLKTLLNDTQKNLLAFFENYPYIKRYELFDFDNNTPYSIVRLYNSDFQNGTLRIKKPGIYRLQENIIFNPNESNDFSPTPEQISSGLYPENMSGPYHLGFFAAITVETENVIIDLNGFTIKQSDLHKLQQRFYANIELANSPFIPNQGPSAFIGVGGYRAANRVLVMNGTSGSTSHHGIHSNTANNVVLHNLTFNNFEVAGIALNGTTNAVFNNLTIENNDKNIPVLSTYSQARFIRKFLNVAKERKPDLKLTTTKTINSIITNIQNDLDNTFENFDFNEIDFNDVEDRIYQYQQLSKFFDVDPDKLSEKYEEVEEEINQLQNFDKEKNKKYKKYQDDLGFFKQEAEKISSLRQKHSISLSKKINLELPDMNIEQGELLFEFLKLDEDNFNIDGIDELEVKFRTNKKADFSSIKKVASGGELSRLLLIIKSLSADFDNDLILIFDEVDSGLSGKIASNVSEKIMKLSKNNQIIAITHSAQVASKADKHWKIFKEIKGENLESKLIELSDKDRILEIATLISGAKITDESKKVASNLLKGS